MLTGDKGETAKNIAISCGLIKENNNAVFELSGTSKDELIEQLKNIF
jgi:magnesium-transporting ATPase (P-type)